MAEQATRLVLVDDHAMLREGLRRSLLSAGYEVVGEASDGQQGIDVVTQLRPDVVLMDVTMPVLDGLEATRRLHAQLPEIKVVMLTMHADPQLAHAAEEAGAMGYLVKDCTTEDITRAISKAQNGEYTFPDAVEAISNLPSGGGAKPLITQREAEVLQLIADGKTTSDAAQELFVSVKTVKNHLASAYAKLDAHDRTQAVLRAARLGLIHLKE